VERRVPTLIFRLPTGDMPLAPLPLPCPWRRTAGWTAGCPSTLASTTKGQLNGAQRLRIDLAPKLAHRVAVGTLCVEPWVRHTCPGGPGVLLCLRKPRRLTAKWPGRHQRERTRNIRPGPHSGRRRPSVERRKHLGADTTTRSGGPGMLLVHATIAGRRSRRSRTSRRGTGATPPRRASLPWWPSLLQPSP